MGEEQLPNPKSLHLDNRCQEQQRELHDGRKGCSYSFPVSVRWVIAHNPLTRHLHIPFSLLVTKLMCKYCDSNNDTQEHCE